MKQIKTVLLIGVFICLAVSLVGCGSKAADENRPLSEIKAEAEKMDAAQLKEMALKYKDAITAKKADVDAVMAKLKAIPVTKLMGDEAKGVKQEVDDLSKSLKALTERFNVYYDKYKTSGGDVSDLKI